MNGGVVEELERRRHVTKQIEDIASRRINILDIDMNCNNISSSKWKSESCEQTSNWVESNWSVYTDRRWQKHQGRSKELYMGLKETS